VREIIFLDKFFEEACNDSGSGFDGHTDHLRSRRLNRADSGFEKLSNIFTCLVPLFSLDSLLEVSDFLRNYFLVECQVPGNFGYKLGLVLENLCPIFDGFNVLRNGFAGA